MKIGLSKYILLLAFSCTSREITYPLRSFGINKANKLQLFTPYGQTKSPQSYGFTGQEFNALLSISDSHTRSYSTQLGQFLQADLIFVAGKTPYHYVLGNPLGYTDPDGKLYRSALPLVAKQGFARFATIAAGPAGLMGSKIGQIAGDYVYNTWVRPHVAQYHAEKAQAEARDFANRVQIMDQVFGAQKQFPSVPLKTLFIYWAEINPQYAADLEQEMENLALMDKLPDFMRFYKDPSFRDRLKKWLTREEQLWLSFVNERIASLRELLALSQRNTSVREALEEKLERLFTIEKNLMDIEAFRYNTDELAKVQRRINNMTANSARPSRQLLDERAIHQKNIGSIRESLTQRGVNPDSVLTH